jgi:hypothetical protein
MKLKTKMIPLLALLAFTACDAGVGQECRGDDECPKGASCLKVATAMRCSAVCETDTDCTTAFGAGYTCFDPANTYDGKFCVKSCEYKDDGACGANNSCIEEGRGSPVRWGCWPD